MSVAVPVIASVDLSDPLNKRIHLLAGVTTYHPVDDIAMEILKRRADEIDNLRKVRLPVEAFGNAPKNSTGTRRTSKFARFYDTKIIPFGDQDIKVTGEQTYVENGVIIGSEELVMDLATVSINMSYAAPDTEVVVITIGSGVTAQDKIDIAAKVWANITRTLTSGSASITPQDILDITESVWTRTIRDITNSSGGALTALQEQQLQELWQIEGLDSNNPMTATKTSRIVAGVVQIFTGDRKNSTTATRQ